MNTGWSNEQQRCLAALGYTLYGSAAPMSPVDIETASLPLRGADMRSAVRVAAQQPSEVSFGAENASTPLLRALLRAAGFDPAAIADAQSWLSAQQVPSLAQLRNDPAAKRVLWPRLRALRRERTNR